MRAALVPAVLLATTGSALGGLVVSASAQEPTSAAQASTEQLFDPALAMAEREASVESLAARASRDRARAEAARVAAEQAAAAEAARVAAEQAAAAEVERVAAEQAAAAEAERVAAEAARLAAEEAARPKYARPGDGRLTSSFGHRWGRLHAGIDLAAGTGSPIRAAAAGTVVSARDEGGYGKCIRIEHADGGVTVYAHLSAFEVKAGQKVGPGEQIGREGNTGQSTGPHLHFEVRYRDQPVDPRAWLAKGGVGV